MKIKRLDHIGINVIDLPKAKQFFVDLGMEVVMEMRMEGELVEKVIGLTNVVDDMVMLKAPEGDAMIELVKFHSPIDEKGLQTSESNTLGLRHFCLAVEDIDAMVSMLHKKGYELVGEMQSYQNIYKLCYVRGPEGIIVEIAEKIG